MFYFYCHAPVVTRTDIPIWLRIQPRSNFWKVFPGPCTLENNNPAAVYKSQDWEWDTTCARNCPWQQSKHSLLSCIAEGHSCCCYTRCNLNHAANLPLLCKSQTCVCNLLFFCVALSLSLFAQTKQSQKYLIALEANSARSYTAKSKCQQSLHFLSARFLPFAAWSLFVEKKYHFADRFQNLLLAWKFCTSESSLFVLSAVKI